MTDATPKTIEFHPKGRYKLGKLLGEGSQGKVYSLVDIETGEDDKWAVKATQIKKTKKKQTSTELVLLQKERRHYLSDFKSLQGEMIPRVPGLTKGLRQWVSDEQGTPKVKRDRSVSPPAEGWACLVIERMNEPLWDAILNIPPNTRKRQYLLGEYAVRMLEIVRRVHEKDFVVCDMKPENFMLAAGPRSPESLRLLDLGLVQHWRATFGTAKHAPNEGTKDVVGTPLYASLNVHELETCSRRDDIEAMLYLWADLIIGVHAREVGMTKKWFKKDSYLPWSQGSSDQDIGQMKTEMVADEESEFYERMPPAIAAVWMECWQHVRTYSYKEEPSYDWLEKKLAKFAVPIAKKTSNTKKPARASKSPTPVKSCVTRNASGAFEVDIDEEIDSDAEIIVNGQLLRKSPVKRRMRRITTENDDDEESIESVPKRRSTRNHQIDDDTKPFASSRSSASIDTRKARRGKRDKDESSSDGDPMEIDEILSLEDENEEPHGNGAAIARKYLAARLEVISGPHKGESFVLQEGEEEQYIIGSKPSKKDHIPLCLKKDKSVEAKHARVKLNLSKKLVRVNVWDLKSESGVLVDNLAIKGESALFCGSILTVGNTKFKLAKVS